MLFISKYECIEDGPTILQPNCPFNTPPHAKPRQHPKVPTSVFAQYDNPKLPLLGFDVSWSLIPQHVTGHMW